MISVLQGNAQYFHNVSNNSNHWILLKLVGVKSNRMGLGAQVRITTDAGVQYNHATTSVGYACSSDPRVHFGLGASKVVKEIDIVWPSRIHQTLRNVSGGSGSDGHRDGRPAIGGVRTVTTARASRSRLGISEPRAPASGFRISR